MSFKVYWERINDEHAVKVKDFLNTFFSTIPKPELIADISITSLSLGSTGPPLLLILPTSF